MSGHPKHRHDTFHRGVVPEEQLAANEDDAGVGDVLTRTGTGEAEWETPSGGDDGARTFAFFIGGP